MPRMTEFLKFLQVELHQLLVDLTPFLQALGPILIAYWGYRAGNKLSKKEQGVQDKKEKDKND